MFTGIGKLTLFAFGLSKVAEASVKFAEYIFDTFLLLLDFATDYFKYNFSFWNSFI